jgi:hypothetical protein
MGKMLKKNMTNIQIIPNNHKEKEEQKNKTKFGPIKDETRLVHFIRKIDEDDHSSTGRNLDRSKRWQT